MGLIQLQLTDNLPTVVAEQNSNNGFLQSMIGNYNSHAFVTGAKTLTDAETGSLIECTGSTTYTVTLPNPIGKFGEALTFWIANSVGVTLTTPAGAFSPGYGGVSSLFFANGAKLEFISDGYNWFVVYDSTYVISIIIPTLVNSWVISSGDIGYRKDQNNMVYFHANVKSGTTATVCTLPTGYRPIAAVNVPCVDMSTNLPVGCNVNADGTLTPIGYNATNGVRISGSWLAEQ
jgi:hypothetical protein